MTTDFPKRVPGKPVPPVASAPGGAAGVQSAEEVADRIADLIDHPRAELYTNPAHPAIAREYYADAAAFEEKLFQRR